MEGESYPLSHLGTWQLIVCLFFHESEGTYILGLSLFGLFFVEVGLKIKFFAWG